ncbi:uncharacterized protein Bfra_000206 [Botrytis fragariae]|uniref:Uncharacterized protein n=1 Tax=Botrytis fragariae TaxID=1964551 RepID=A0A8H6EMY6_9HELO|nr:uncharacterized protein Bfra_000206 [Botrytis fragariae]KAF5878039.1 hypothetical protein Bfra_000206 [Botrytis fragariae]
MRTEGPSTSPSGECLPIYRAKTILYKPYILRCTDEYNFILRGSFDTPYNGQGPIIKGIVGFLNFRNRD